MFADKMSNIPVKTNPEGATVSVYAGLGGKIFEGKTPCVLVLTKKEIVSGKMIISMKGYKNTEINMGASFENSAVANVCLLPFFWIGVGIDFVSGSLFKPEIETVNIILEPETEKNSLNNNHDSIILSQNISIDIQKNGSEYFLYVGK
jgi:hypothetical protein